MATIKEASQVFGRCINWQHVYQRRNLISFLDHIDQAYCDHLVSECKKNETLYKSIVNLLGIDDKDHPNLSGAFMIKKRATAKKLLALIDANIPALLSYLRAHHFASSTLNQQQSADTEDNVVNQYTLLLNTLFYHENKFIRNEYLFSMAGLFFEYCFVNDSHDEFLAMLYDQACYPLTRLICTILWEFLSADGWRNWHADSLSFLRKESEKGKRIVYVAGATDVYQLLKHGVYNIEVIDPFLPSQAADYYSEGWSWLIGRGEIGDQINITEDVMIRREDHELFGVFNVTMPSGEIFNINHTHTAWLVCDRHSSQIMGSVVFDRRFIVQDDFLLNEARLLLLSFNELYLLSAPSHCFGWGIDAEALVDDMSIAVKQLSNPITAAAFKRLAKSTKTPFEFVNLGGSAI